MILEPLREAIARMADTPVLWITGLYSGVLFTAVILLDAQGNAVLGARLGFLGLCALPFFLGGSYGTIQGGNRTLHGYLVAGSRYFFRILIAGAVVVSAALLTAFLVLLPFTVSGGSFQPVATLVLPGVAIPFAFFTFFFDTAAVFEDRKVLASLRRSVEFVLGNPREAVAFYLAALAIGALIFFISVVAWSFTIADRLQPLMDTNQTMLGNLTAGELVNIVGAQGLWTGAAVGFLAVAIGGVFLVSFKACFYRRAMLSTPDRGAQGEFDEKGRWYRY